MNKINENQLFEILQYLLKQKENPLCFIFSKENIPKDELLDINSFITNFPFPHFIEDIIFLINEGNINTKEEIIYNFNILWNNYENLENKPLGFKEIIEILKNKIMKKINLYLLNEEDLYFYQVEKILNETSKTLFKRKENFEIMNEIFPFSTNLGDNNISKKINPL